MWYFDGMRDALQGHKGRDMEEQRRQIEEELEKRRRHPAEPERDVLLFLLENAPLERWQRDVLDMVWLINHGQIFRFLRKPLSPGRCGIALQAALKHHRMLLQNPALIKRHEVKEGRQVVNALYWNTARGWFRV